jgi:hypothetical protein
VAEANTLVIGLSGLMVAFWLGVSGLLRRYGKKPKREEVLVFLGMAGGISWLSRRYEKSKIAVGTLGMEVSRLFRCDMYLLCNWIFIVSMKIAVMFISPRYVSIVQLNFIVFDNCSNYSGMTQCNSMHTRRIVNGYLGIIPYLRH